MHANFTLKENRESLLDFLRDGRVSIRVYASDIYLGTCHVPVSKFLRQGKQEIEKLVKVDLKMGKEIIGTLSVRIRNEGHFDTTTEEEFEEPSAPKTVFAKRLRPLEPSLKDKYEAVEAFWDKYDSWAGMKISRDIYPDMDYESKIMERIKNRPYVLLCVSRRVTV